MSTLVDDSPITDQMQMAAAPSPAHRATPAPVTPSPAMFQPALRHNTGSGDTDVAIAHAPAPRGYATVAIVACMAPEGGAAFALACGDFSVAVISENSTSEMHALIDAFEYVIVHPHFADQDIEILVANEGFASAVAALLAAWPHITVTTVAPTGYLMHRAARMAHKITHPADEADERGPAATAQPQARLTCATDGSAGWAKNPVAAFGWVTESGESGGGVIGNQAVRVAELAAVTSLLDAAPRNRPLRVLIDSLEVLDLVSATYRDVRAGRVINNWPASVAPAQWCHRYITRMLSTMAGRDLVFEKVAAHTGHALNETADRLAVYHRRVAQMSVSREIAGPVIDRIVAEGLWQWSEQQTQARSQTQATDVSSTR